MTSKTKTLTLMTVAAALAAHGQSSQPAATASAPAPKLSETEQTIQDIKNPASWLKWGADLRLRNEYYDNARTLSPKRANNEQDYFRMRARLWASLTPAKGFSINVRITTEPRYYVDPSDSTAFNKGQNAKYGVAGSGAPTTGYVGGDWTYGIIDNLNAHYKGTDVPLTVTLGRQDITLGEGWLVADGTPLDGSWTYYFDAARISYDFKEQHTTVDAIGLMQFARSDEWLPVINSQHRAVADQNEKGGILYVNNTSIKEANLGAYFMYKGDTRLNNVDTTPIGANGDDADIFTIGARVNGVLADHWTYSAEGAYQLGQRRDPLINNALLDRSARTTQYRDISAYGVNTKAGYMFKDSMKNTVGLTYEFLSGDKSNTKNDESFDPLWGRYPRWTDLYTFNYATESRRIADYNNYHRFGPVWTVSPIKNLDVSVMYNVLFADQNVPTRAATSNVNGANRLFDGGYFRGQYVQTLLRYKFNPHVATLLQGEVFFPGDYYTSPTVMSFIRAEVSLTF